MNCFHAMNKKQNRSIENSNMHQNGMSTVEKKKDCARGRENPNMTKKTEQSWSDDICEKK